MKSSTKVVLLLLGAAAATGAVVSTCDSSDDGFVNTKEDVQSQRTAPECTTEADSDVDCIPPDGGHSEGTQQAYFHDSTPAPGGNNAFLWYWLGTQNSRTVYVAPPAASPTYARAPSARPGFTESPALSARGGFGASGVAHGASGAS